MPVLWSRIGVRRSGRIWARIVITRTVAIVVRLDPNTIAAKPDASRTDVVSMDWTGLSEDHVEV